MQNKLISVQKALHYIITNRDIDGTQQSSKWLAWKRINESKRMKENGVQQQAGGCSRRTSEAETVE